MAPSDEDSNKAASDLLAQLDDNVEEVGQRLLIPST